ncbi:hypothetical protein RGQ29_017826 [Quercus rubra]|uniref:Intracellular protein transporter USO1-like protein n=1 Tax=Quercus rubra TaxID=3512 RepID=A0AAN7FHZ1_QUERU|nr:hypothetical protein RGQ29_017826 [Quercus rubra]
MVKKLKQGMFLITPHLSQQRNISTSISARKLCANLWEIQPHHHYPVAKMSKNGARLRRHKRRENKRFQISKHLVDPPSTRGPNQPESKSSLRRHVAASLIQHPQSVDRNDSALQPISPSSYSSSFEVVPYNPVVTPTKSLDFNGRMGESSYSLKTSTELLKVINRIWSLEEQHASNISLVKALKMKLYLSQARIKELLEEKHLERHEMDDLMMQVQDRIQAAVESIRDELEDERKLRKHSESLHRKLAQELSELNSSFYNALRELERERKARILLENLCDEFAKGIREYEQEVRSLKHKTVKGSKHGLMNGCKMKLAEAQNDLAEKKTIVDKIGFDIETFLQAKRSIKSRKNGNFSLVELKKICSRKPSFESFPLNEPVSATKNAADEGDSPTDSDSHCFKPNKETDGKQSKGSCKRNSDNAAESHQNKIVKSNSIRKNFGLWEIDEVCNPSSLQGQFNKHMAKAMPCNGNNEFPGRQQGEMCGEKQDVINYTEKFGMCEATEGLHERHGKRVGACGLNTGHMPDNLIRSHSLPLEDDKIHPQSNCKEDSCVRSMLTGNANPVQQWMSKLTTPDVENSESTLRWPRGLKENTLLAKLLEARLEAQLSRSKASKISF